MASRLAETGPLRLENARPMDIAAEDNFYYEDAPEPAAENPQQAILGRGGCAFR